jgi:hypothetical protein
MRIAVLAIMSTWKWIPALLLSVTAAADPSTGARRGAGELCEINFDAHSVTPAEEADEINTQIDVAASWAADNLDGVLVLDGHAEHSDQQGADITLALQRAVTVRDMLTRAGVNSGQIVIAAFGENHDACENPAERRSVTVWATHEGFDRVIARLSNADEIMLSGSVLPRSPATNPIEARCAVDAPASVAGRDSAPTRRDYE